MSHTGLFNCFLNSDGLWQLSQGCQFIYLHFTQSLATTTCKWLIIRCIKNKEKNWDDCIANWEWKKTPALFFLLYSRDKVLFSLNIATVAVNYLHNHISYEILRWLNGCGPLCITLISLKRRAMYKDMEYNQPF